MIYYFSGMGNTKFLAHRIKDKIGEELKFIPELIAEEERFSGKTLGFLFPIYSWGIPANVKEFIERLSETFWKDIRDRGVKVWMVCSYGDEIGATATLLNNILKKCEIELSGAWGVRMPNTYVLLPGFDVDSKDLEIKKLIEAQDKIEIIVEKINSGNWEWDLKKGSFPSLRTKLIYPLFLKWGINPKKWGHTEACVKCGKCVRACSKMNIAMGENGPEWGMDCISCLACYHHCPYHAVKYGNITKSKGQYLCPLNNNNQYI